MAASSLPRYAELRRRLLEDRDLSRFWSYFLDDFIENQQFQEDGRPCDDPKLRDWIRQIGGTLFGKPEVRISGLMLIEVPEQHLVHGIMTLEDKIATVVYLRDKDTGTISVAMNEPRDGDIRILRFSPAQLEKLKPSSGMTQ